MNLTAGLDFRDTQVNRNAVCSSISLQGFALCGIQEAAEFNGTLFRVLRFVKYPLGSHAMF